MQTYCVDILGTLMGPVLPGLRHGGMLAFCIAIKFRCKCDGEVLSPIKKYGISGHVTRHNSETHKVPPGFAGVFQDHKFG